jgi:hypothetical protein
MVILVSPPLMSCNYSTYDGIVHLDSTISKSLKIFHFQRNLYMSWNSDVDLTCVTDSSLWFINFMVIPSLLKQKIQKNSSITMNKGRIKRKHGKWYRYKNTTGHFGG